MSSLTLALRSDRTLSSKAPEEIGPHASSRGQAARQAEWLKARIGVAQDPSKLVVVDLLHGHTTVDIDHGARGSELVG
jgi:hypothetical protein